MGNTLALDCSTKSTGWATKVDGILQYGCITSASVDVEKRITIMRDAIIRLVEDYNIDKIIVERLNDGQLADSPLTLKDLKVIAMTFSRILRGMQHNRIKYQENIAEEFGKNKIEMPNVILDEDLANKINELEESKRSNNQKISNENDNNKSDLGNDSNKDL